jgi:hypothetical protein
MLTPRFEVGTQWRLPPPPGGLRRAEGGQRCALQAAPPAPTQPLVSYITVVRNAAGTLARTLASVRAQQGAAVEHIVIDALSDDGTLALIEAHAAQIDYYVSEPDAGLYDALNKAMALVRGSLVCVLNADDWLAADAAATALAALQRHEPQPLQPAPRLILSAAWQHNGTRRRLWLPGVLDAGSWLRCPNICHNGVYATPAALRAAGPYDTRLRIVADSRWLLAARDAGVAIHTLHAPTVHYVTGGLSGDVSRHVRECAQLLAQGFPALDEAEVWTLLHAFYPWAGNLQPFADRCPPHLGQALQALAARHAGDTRLQACLQAAGWEAQRGQARRVPFKRPLAADLQRGWARLRYTLRDVWARSPA